MNPENIRTLLAIAASIASLLGGFYVAVTRPLLLLLKSELKAVHIETGSIQTQLTDKTTAIQTQLTDIVTRLGRIETKLDDHGERITRLEERTSPLRR